MADELFADGLPGPSFDRAAAGCPVGQAAQRVLGERPDGVAYGGRVAGCDEEPGPAVCDEVQRPPAAGAITGTPLAMASCTVWQNVS